MQYLIILNDDGSKHAALAVGLHGDTVEELRAVAERDYPDKKYLEGDSLINNSLGEPRSRWDGEKVVIDPLPEPTPSEIEAKAKHELDAEYQAQRKAMQEAMMTALLAGNDDALKGIREDCAALEEWYADELANIGKE